MLTSLLKDHTVMVYPQEINLFPMAVLNKPQAAIAEF